MTDNNDEMLNPSSEGFQEQPEMTSAAQAPEPDDEFEAVEIQPPVPIEEEIIARASGNHDPMPMLDVIFARMATSFSPMLKTNNGFLSETSEPQLSYKSWGKMIESLDPNGVAAVVKSSFGGPIFLAFDAAFLHSTQVYYLGGKPSNADVMRRQPTTIERAFARRLMNQTLDELAMHFSRIVEVEFKLETVEGPSQLNALMNSSSLMSICEFEVVIGPVVGRISLILPMQTLEPARDRLSKMFLGDKLGGDTSWRDHFADHISGAQMTLQVQLHRLSIPLSTVLEWRPGAMIDLGIDTNTEATVICSGHPILKGATGRKRNGKMALRVTQEIGETEGAVADDNLFNN